MSVTSTQMTINSHHTGPHSGTERFEVWLRSVLTNVWARKADHAIAGAADLATVIPNLPPGTTQDVAMRLTRSGAAQAGSTSADPTAWPAGHRQMGVHMLLDDLVDDGSFVGEGLGAPDSRMLWGAFHITPSDLTTQFVPTGAPFDLTLPDIRYEVEWSATGMDTWAAVTNGFFDHVAAVNTNIGHGRWYGTPPEDPIVANPQYNADSFSIDADTFGLLVGLNDYAGTTIDLRLRRVAQQMDGTVMAEGNWLVLAGLVVPAI